MIKIFIFTHQLIIMIKEIGKIMEVVGGKSRTVLIPMSNQKRENFGTP